MKYSLNMNNRTLLACMCLSAVLAGCGTTRVTTGDVSVTPEPDRALVVGFGNTAGEAAMLVFKKSQGTLVSNLNVALVNGQKIPYGQNIGRVTPGEYDLTIFCGIYIDDRFFDSSSVIHANLAAGRIYRLRSHPRRGNVIRTLKSVAASNGRVAVMAMAREIEYATASVLI